MNKTIHFIKLVLQSNPDYNQKDLDWIENIFINHYETLTGSSQNFYKSLALLYRKTYCGYFAQLYNYDIYFLIRNQNEEEFIKKFTTPIFDELDTNKYLNDEENKLMLNILYLEMLSMNLTMVKFLISYGKKFPDLYDESYQELYTKMYINTIPESRSYFDDFVTLGKFSPKIRAKRAFSYPLLDIVMILTTGVEHDYINDSNRSMLEEKYDLEIKLMRVTADKAREMTINEVSQ